MSQFMVRHHGRTRHGLGRPHLVFAFIFIALTPIAACHRRVPGTCAEDVDCAPGFDCRAGVCARRERMRFGASTGAKVAPSVVDFPPPPSAPSLDPSPSDASAVDADGAATAPPAHRPAPTVPKARDVPPPPPLPAPPPGGREPLWKQRLRNS